MSQQHLCPQLYLWRQIYTSLSEARQAAGNMDIPMPPQVFNMQGWMLSSDENKRNRWQATVEWAAKYGFSDAIPEIIEEDWYEG